MCVLCYWYIEGRVSQKPQTVSGGERFFWRLGYIESTNGSEVWGKFWKAPAVNHRNCLSVWNPLTNIDLVVGRMHTLCEYRKGTYLLSLRGYEAFLYFLWSYPMVVWVNIYFCFSRNFLKSAGFIILHYIIYLYLHYVLDVYTNRYCK